MDDLFTIARKGDKDSGAIIWTDAQKRYILEQYSNQVSSNIIAEQFHTSGEAIRRLLRKEGITIISHKKRLPRNSDYFECIDTPEKAYCLGLMYAYGYGHQERYTVGLGLIDKEHIEKFLVALGAPMHTITECQQKNSSRPSYKAQIRDKKMFNDLVAWNVIPRKSFQEIPFLDLHDEELMRNFIRGYFDGDGSFTFSMTKGNFKVSFVGNRTFLSGLRAYLHKDNISLIKEKRSNITYAFALSGRKQVPQFLTWLYTNSSDSTRLKRKYDKYCELMNYLGPTSLNSDI